MKHNNRIYLQRAWSLILAGTSVVSVFSQKIQESQSNKKDRKPNVIYFYFDDLGYGELGCYGQQKIKTPNIDQLAQKGIRFTQHYTTFPVSAPARCGLLTGKHSGHSFVRGNYEMGGFTDDTEGGQMPLPEGTYTIANLMKQAGYVTGGIGKWGLGMPFNSGNPNRHGFDYFYGYMDQKQSHNFYPTHLWENSVSIKLNNEYVYVHQHISHDSKSEAFEPFKGKDYAIDRMAEKTLAFINEHKDEPFFLYLPYTTPHVSLQAPDSAVREYIGQFDEQPYYGDQGYAPCCYPLSTYAAMITYTDKQIGNIMALLKELRLDENTIILISSDNGTTFNGGVNREFFHSTAGLRGCKMDLYEGGIRIPLVVRWPKKIPAGKISNLISAQYDLFATLSDLTGVKPEWKTDGISFLPTLLGQGNRQEYHEYLYFEYPEKSGQIAIIKGNMKGVKSNLEQGPGTWEIFDLRTDREERHNLAQQSSELIKEFEAIIQKEHWNATLTEWEFINPKKGNTQK